MKNKKNYSLEILKGFEAQYPEKVEIYNELLSGHIYLFNVENYEGMKEDLEIMVKLVGKLMGLQ